MNTNKAKAIEMLDRLKMYIQENNDFCMNEVLEIESIKNFINKNL